MDAGQSTITLQPIGVVHSSIKDTESMPLEGAPAVLEIRPEYAAGLAEIASNSHLVVLGWFHLAERDTLTATGPLSEAQRHPERGVFGLRSGARPNPIAMKVVRLQGVDGTSLHVEGLDFVDGTALLDVKRYSPTWDSVFSARTSRETRYREGRAPLEQLQELAAEAANFHGEHCQGVALAARIVQHAMRTWQMPQKSPDLRVWIGEDPCVFDALQALLGLTVGSKRLKIPGGRTYRLVYQDEALIYYPREIGDRSPAEILEAPLDQLFSVRHETDYTPFEKTAEERQRGTTLPREQEETLVARVQDSLVNGKLPCPVAFKLAAELGIHVSQVGRAADLIKAKISHCQLGCFK